jgi:hypothetical protein
MSGELILRTGPADGPRVLIVPPLFEEANRTRRTLVLAMRALAAHGLGALLPDLPGQNDSLVPTHRVDLGQWRAALAAVVAAETAPVVIASVRGGALIDAVPGPIGWWRLAPVTGAGILRPMLRSRVASDREAGVASNSEALLAAAATEPLELAGNRLSPAMIAQLQAAAPQPVSPLRERALGSGDGALAGTPLWLRAEPGEDAALAAAMAADIADWVPQCAKP